MSALDVNDAQKTQSSITQQYLGVFSDHKQSYLVMTPMSASAQKQTLESL